MEIYDVVVIGGGVIGCSILHELTKQGYKTVLCEKNSELVAEASSGNSGMVHSGFDVYVPTELQFLQMGGSLNEPTFQKYDIPYKKVDALMVAWTEEELKRIPQVIERAHQVGVHDVRQVSLQEMRRMEPQLSQDALGAVFIPGEMLVDSWLLPITLAHHALQQGAQIFRNCKVTNGYKTTNDDWLLMTTMGPIRAGVVVNCAGLYGDWVEEIHQSCPFQIKPRKGQFVVFERCAEEVLGTMILAFPSPRTKGVLVYPTVYGHVVVGPTADEQESRQDRTVDPVTREKLINHARRVVPALKQRRVISAYAGIRPATNSADYNIIADEKRSWITVGGIRSTGVSASLALAQYVSGEVANKFKKTPTNQKAVNNTRTRTGDGIPKLNFRVLPSGHITLNGQTYKITHPLSRLGLLAKHKL